MLYCSPASGRSSPHIDLQQQPDQAVEEHNRVTLTAFSQPNAFSVQLLVNTRILSDTQLHRVCQEVATRERLMRS